MTRMDMTRRRLRSDAMVPRSLAIIESAISRLSPLVSLCNAFELPRAVAFVPLAMFYTLLVNITPGFEG
jgi:hypothetical protein